MPFDLDSIYFTPPHKPFLADDSRVGIATNMVVWGPQVLWAIAAILVLWRAIFRLKGWRKPFFTVFAYGMMVAALVLLWTSLSLRLGPCHPENIYDIQCGNRVIFAYLSLPSRYALLALLACHAWFWLVKRFPQTARPPG